MKNRPHWSHYRPKRSHKTPYRVRLWQTSTGAWGLVTCHGKIVYTARGLSDTEVHQQLRRWVEQHEV